MINQQLIDFIKGQLQKGLTKEKISSELLANNWTTEDIEEGFKAVVPFSNFSSTGQSISADNTKIQTQQIKYAGFWTRFVANFIDGLVIIVLSLIVGLIIGMICVMIKVSNEIAVIIGGIFGTLTVWIYFVFMTHKYQATYGKKLVGIRVVSMNGESLTLGQIILRETIGKIASAIILYIGYIMAGFTEKKQALHDKIANTAVVHNDPNKKMPKWIIITMVIIVFVIPFILGTVSAVVIGMLNKNINSINKTGQAIEQNSLPNPYVNEEHNFSFSYPENINLSKNENKGSNVLSLGLNYSIHFKETNTLALMPLGGVHVGEQTYQNFIEKMKNTKTLNNISEEVIEKNGIMWNVALIKDVNGLPTMKRIMTQKDNLNYGLLLMYSGPDAEESKNLTKEENNKINAKYEEINAISEKIVDTFIDTFKFTDTKNYIIQNNTDLCKIDSVCNEYFNTSMKEKLFYKTIEEVFNAINNNTKTKSKDFKYVKISGDGQNTFLLAENSKNFPDELALVYLYTGKISFAPKVE